METVRQYIEQQLYHHGLWENQIKEVLDKVIANDKNSVRWDDPKSGYPDALYLNLMISVRRQAIQWIDENCPHHFARVILDY